jgi:hypothetical protein
MTAGDLQPETPTTAQNFQGRAHCNLECFRNRVSSAFFSVCLKGKRRSLLVYVESSVSATPKRFHANTTQTFPRFPLVSPWAKCQAREYCSASHLIIANSGCSDARSCRSLRRCVCDCLRHNSPSRSLWLPLRPGKSRKASVPFALVHSKNGLTAR